MDRRHFLIGAGVTGVLALAGCSTSMAEDLDLPAPMQAVRPPAPIAAGMVGLASFFARVLVLSKRDYPVSPADVLSAVSPLDLAVAWGLAAKADARAAVELTQSERRYHWRARQSDMDIPGVRAFTRYSGNWHMVPATDEVMGALQGVNPGDLVRIEGDLVEVTFSNGIYYKSSLSRDDVGDGACEIIRATSIVVERATRRS